MGLQGISTSENGRFERTAIGMTKHAGIRVQQRGVNRDVLECLLTHGRHEPDHKGCHVVTFDGRALDNLSRFEPKELNARAVGARNLYAVVDSNGVVVTAGYRFRRVPRDLSLSSLRPGRSRRPHVLHSRTNSYHH